MITEIDIKTSSMHLHGAILLYATGEHVVYATRHSVQQNKNGGPVILPGVPVSHEYLTDAYNDLIGKTALKMLPKNALAFNVNTLVFWTPPKVRHLRFSCPEPMGERSGLAPNPGLIFILKKHHLSVFAFKGNKKPSLNTELFNAPYMNIYDAGDMCLGNVNLPDPESCDVASCEAAFFNSYFTHANHGKQVEYTGGIYSLWIDLLESTGNVDAKFPEDVMIPRMPINNKDKFTLADLLSGNEG